MIPQNPIQQLCDLDKTSPQFHERLGAFFRGDVYRTVFPGLQSEGLALLVEYLDSVSLRIILLHTMLNITVGSRRDH